MATKSRKPPRNPELEAMRDLILKTENVNLEQIIERFAKDLAGVHACFLFIEKSGMEVVKTVSKLLTATSDNVIHSNWKDLGAHLDLTLSELLCIENGQYRVFGRCPDYTEIVLITFTQHRESTIGRILKALLTINRLDVLSGIIVDLEELVKIMKLKTLEIEEFNSESTIADNSLRPMSKIIIPQNFEAIIEFISRKLLPITLSEQVRPELLIHQNNTSDRHIQIESIQQSNIITNSDHSSQHNESFQYSKLVMLTFAADGERIAKKLANMLSKVYINSLPIGVLMLQNHKNDVISNAEQFISHLFPQMDYIIPILTEGYFEALTNEKPTPTSCLDERYVLFIHDLMAKYYVENRCRNKKIRCIIPNNAVQDIYNKPKFKNDPVLQAWVKECETDDLARSMTRCR